MFITGSNTEIGDRQLVSSCHFIVSLFYEFELFDGDYDYLPRSPWKNSRFFDLVTDNVSPDGQLDQLFQLGLEFLTFCDCLLGLVNL